jgi:hypothetical protein
MDLMPTHLPSAVAPRRWFMAGAVVTHGDWWLACQNPVGGWGCSRILAPETRQILGKGLDHCRRGDVITDFMGAITGRECTGLVRLVQKTEANGFPVPLFHFAINNADYGHPIPGVREPVESESAVASGLGVGRWSVFCDPPRVKPVRLKQIDFFCITVAGDVHLVIPATLRLRVGAISRLVACGVSPHSEEGGSENTIELGIKRGHLVQIGGKGAPGD